MGLAARIFCLVSGRMMAVLIEMESGKAATKYAPSQHGRRCPPAFLLQSCCVETGQRYDAPDAVLCMNFNPNLRVQVGVDGHSLSTHSRSGCTTAEPHVRAKPPSNSNIGPIQLITRDPALRAAPLARRLPRGSERD
ncbi:hypothetical protein TPAR_04702 [Tolypocladium paradoxum]|uniref:Secreted protein n=1 Tax=Tolypocladium paradoxum TaxID=94208 RepID=A0A2S4KY27_9HYPO|nr:hypothetical protein TPAR_04702 [Tolypocladium paradoxum]